MTKRLKKKVSVVFGTRPEAIKLAPVISALRNTDWCECRVCTTGQHRSMLHQTLGVFDIRPDVDFGLMREDQSLGSFTSSALAAIDRYLASEKPDLVVVQGDTTSVFCAALGAFYHKIPVAHVEAGLRTNNLWSPWPEEANRVMTSRLTTIHFAPTEQNQRQLIKEGVDPRNVFITGNTVVDALFLALRRIRQFPPVIKGLPHALQPASSSALRQASRKRYVLVTGHRRENFGQGFVNICRAIAGLAQRYPDVGFVYPVHLNPNVRGPVHKILGTSAHKQNIHLIEPLPYLEFVALMSNASVILTDSGGVQEEAPSLRKPVFVMRDTTERPEALAAGAVMLVGTDARRIVDAVSRALDAKGRVETGVTKNPYGDGASSQRIVNVLRDFLQTVTPRRPRNCS